LTSSSSSACGNTSRHFATNVTAKATSPNGNVSSSPGALSEPRLSFYSVNEACSGMVSVGSKWAKAPQSSPIFDGSPYSMGGNGEYIPHPGLVLPPPVEGVSPTIYLDAGFGGGCVKSGPFKNMTVNLGPIGLPNTTAGPDGGLGYNPRCLKRDVGPSCTLKSCNYDSFRYEKLCSQYYMHRSHVLAREHPRIPE